MSNYPKDYTYKSRAPLRVDVTTLPQRHQDLLLKDPHFCLLPWIHLHAFPDGRAFPCCLSDNDLPIGNLKKNTMRELWNSEGMKTMRKNMLEGRPSKECTRCYEQEQAGFVTVRNTTGQTFGHHIAIVDETKEDGTLDRFELKYYDVRFSNICNFRCRSCGSTFSSNWHSDEVKLYQRGGQAITYAGRTEDDMWEQMVEHIPHLEQIYFAGGEPLLMEEHYRLLNELIKQGRTNVRLVYNTNLSKLAFKDQSVLDLWKHFPKVAIGASLDASGERAEYMRKGTVWSEIVNNRLQIKEQCPHVDFYISATVSIFNAWHIADFHKEWVDLGLIEPSDFNLNILQVPGWYRVDILPSEIKAAIKEKVKRHINWLEPHDKLTRATNGYKSLLNFIDGEQPINHLNYFFYITDQLDDLRNEDFFATFPELIGLKVYARLSGLKAYATLI